MSSATGHRFLTPDEGKYFVLHRCDWHGCHAHARHKAIYRYVISRRTGRVTTRYQGLCDEHAQAFAKKHNLEVPT